MYLQEVPNPLDQDGKLSALFVEYMMGLPVGWVTDTGLSRAQQLKMLGNGVVPQQAELALELLCDGINISHNETLYQPMLGDA
jgi:DNA (cytosine-5)-methyltransferase 1